jgi:hypothetical protein
LKAAYASDLPASVLEVIDNVKKYAEGGGVRLLPYIPPDGHEILITHRDPIISTAYLRK